MTLTRRAHKYKILTDSIHKEGLGPIRQKTKVSPILRFCVEWERACQSVLSWKPIVFFFNHVAATTGLWHPHGFLSVATTHRSCHSETSALIE